MTAKALTDLYPQDIIELPMRKGREKQIIIPVRMQSKRNECADPGICRYPVQEG